MTLGVYCVYGNGKNSTRYLMQNNLVPSNLVQNDVLLLIGVDLHFYHLRHWVFRALLNKIIQV